MTGRKSQKQINETGETVNRAKKKHYLKQTALWIVIHNSIKHVPPMYSQCTKIHLHLFSDRLR